MSGLNPVGVVGGGTLVVSLGSRGLAVTITGASTAPASVGTVAMALGAAGLSVLAGVGATYAFTRLRA